MIFGIVLFFVAGCVLSLTTGWSLAPFWLLGGTGTLWLASGFFHHIAHKNYLLLSSFLLLGAFHAQRHQALHQTTIDKENVRQANAWVANITSLPYRKNNSIRFTSEVTHLRIENEWIPVSFNATTSIQTARDTLPLYGTTYMAEADIYPIPPPSNPETFDYKSFMHQQYIDYQSYLNAGEVSYLDTARNTRYYANAARNYLQQVYHTCLPENSAAIVSALSLGTKKSLDSATIARFSNAGTMHVLAVSGLHVGLIYFTLSFIFRYIPLLNRKTILCSVLIAAIIWFYCLLTGFSAAVVRAAVMISILLASKHFRRHVTIYHKLALALLILVVINPTWLLQAGFQLSFLAVLGIATFYEPIYQCWHPPYRIIDYVWSLVSVSIAAQLTTFPLSLFYFHHFPPLFIIANILVVPLAVLLLHLSLLLLIIHPWAWLSGLLSTIINFLCECCMDVMTFINEQSPSLGHIYLTRWHILLLFGIILLTYLSIRFRSKASFRVLLVCFMTLVTLRSITYIKETQQQYLVIHDIPHHTLFETIEGQTMHFYQDTLLTGHEREKVVENFSASKGIRHRAASIQGRSAMIHTSFGTLAHLNHRISVNHIQPRAFDICIISNGAYTDWDKLFAEHPDAFYIIDSSVSKGFCNLLTEKVKKYHLAFHNVRKDGAFIQSY